MLSRPSSMTKLFCGHSLWRWHAPPIPDNPAPTITTSTCSTARPLHTRRFHTRTVLAGCDAVNMRRLAGPWVHQSTTFAASFSGTPSEEHLGGVLSGSTLRCLLWAQHSQRWSTEYFKAAWLPSVAGPPAPTQARLPQYQPGPPGLWLVTARTKSSSGSTKKSIRYLRWNKNG